MGANGDAWVGGCANGDGFVGDCDMGWKPVVCFANGFVDDLVKELAPLGLFKSLGSVAPGAPGSIDCRKGFVDVC